MNKAGLTITTKNGKRYKWEFIEEKSADGYGNGIYIKVISPSREVSCIDCRYDKHYTFINTCLNYISAYYGDNLALLTPEQ